jgi:hypothetical protein
MSRLSLSFRVLIALAAAVSVAHLRPAAPLADNAPMWQSPVGLAPGRPGNSVRMVAEAVQIQVVEREQLAYAVVDATFELLNRGAELRMPVGFPTWANAALLQWPDGEYSPVAFNPDLEQFRAWADGVEQSVALERVILREGDRFGDEWYVWEMTFPSGQPVRVRVTYEQRLAWSHEKGPSFAQTRYVLRTGALWDGTIGEASITMTAPGGGAFLGGPEVAVGTGLSVPAPGEVLGPDEAAEASAARLDWRLREVEPDRDVGALYIYAAPWQALQAGEAALAAGSTDAAVHLRAARAALRLIGSVGEDDLPWGPFGAPKAILERGYPALARQWAERAVALAPDQAAAWETVGHVAFWFARPDRRHLDELACWPTAAVDAYQRAQRLGSTTAGARLEALERARAYTTERDRPEPGPCP